jgi:cell wall-associated NlpC family hydrolase
LIVVMTPPGGYATPDDSRIESVKRQVSRLYHEAEQAAERYNTIRVELKETRSRLATLSADVRDQQARVEELRDQLGAVVAAQAQSAPGGSTSQLLSSGDPEAFLAGLAAVQAYSTAQADQVALLEAESEELRLREEQLQSQVDAIAAAKRDLAAEKAEIDQKSEQAQRLLATLKAKAAAAAAAAAASHEAEVSRDAARPPTPLTPPQPSSDVSPSARAQIAIDFALAQVGDAYVYGAAGPDAWDCSGLTMRAWGAAGVSLPHASSAQLNSGTPVSPSAMQPGDLVFYYSPVSHVGIYLGNGQLVHAPNPSSTVEVLPVNAMPITAVRRVG